MSSWQSFFNQLTKTSKQGNQRSINIICHCVKGKLEVTKDFELKTYNNCSMNSFCAIIQVDKYRAKTFSNKISFVPHTPIVEEENPQKTIIDLDHLFEEKL